MKLILIRHGMTQGNIERRYIGSRTDEDLCAEGIAQLKMQHYPNVDMVFASPMNRCVQTAGIIYPRKTVQIIPDFRECDFGEFEGHNYEELKDNPAYQAWLDSGGELPFPGGESRKEFSARCVQAFEEIIRDLPEGSYAFILHGGTIMAIMEHFAKPAGSYYDYQVQNGRGFILNRDIGDELNDLENWRRNSYRGYSTAVHGNILQMLKELLVTDGKSELSAALNPWGRQAVETYTVIHDMNAILTYTNLIFARLVFDEEIDLSIEELVTDEMRTNWIYLLELDDLVKASYLSEVIKAEENRKIETP